MQPPSKINEIAERLGLPADSVEPFGWYRGKFTHEALAALKPPRARYINVTGVSPTPFGEGKTVTSIALSMGLCRSGSQSIVTIRQPSMAPVFGIKGGGAGEGRAALYPSQEINLHFTGDIHAVASATNLLAALIDNHLKRNFSPQLEASSVTWRRAVDVSDKALSNIEVGLGGGLKGPKRLTAFDLAAASEVMAILAMADSFPDFRRRLDAITVGSTSDGTPVTAQDLKASGALAAVLKEAFRPNLVQTVEGTPALVHAGPFANIAQGNSSVIADRVALSLADYVVTESGFGSDCGAEKFVHLKCRSSGFRPAAEVLVCTVRSLKWHSGKFGTKASLASLPKTIHEPDVAAVEKGAANLIGHIEGLKQYGVPIVVAINRFPTDTEEELQAVKQIALAQGISGCEICTGFSNGSEGALALAEAVKKAAQTPSELKFLYELSDSVETKLSKLARGIYGAEGVVFSDEARRQLEQIERRGLGEKPVCVAKTQYSFSHDPQKLGRPRGFEFPIREIRSFTGAGFLLALSGEMSTMPGLPAAPAAWGISVDDQAQIHGLR